VANVLQEISVRHDDGRLRVIDDVGHLFGAAVPVDGHRRRAERRRGERRFEELVAVSQQERDGATRFHAE